MKLAVSGKGGVGKTLVAGALACYLASKGFNTIAIDADPSPNLALTLGLSPMESRKLVPISENKALIDSKTSTQVAGVYRLSFTVDDIVRRFAVKTPYNVSLLVMGTVKTLGSGCTCAANAVVRSLLRHLIVERGEAIIVDMEAGVEHLGRGTARSVDTMLIVTDSSIKSLETAGHIHELAINAGIGQVFLIGNKVADEDQKRAIESFAERNKLNLLSFIPFDGQVTQLEMKGQTPVRHRRNPAIQAISTLGEELIKLTDS
ncbi:MAG: P-loop NTPase [Candidatus Bathyarchaeota archaeon]|nr:MAG: P-loop NTPase [Candidatus Bathyarchaeota archaeon]